MTVRTATELLFGLVDYEQTPAGMAATRYLNLDRMRAALARAGDPHLGLRCAHIAGTKGKGSTAATLASILRAAGRRVGLFTSPHLVEFRERIRIDDTLIPAAAMEMMADEIHPIIEAMRLTPDGPPTFFEAIALIAFLWFARAGADIVVLETGMGGRLDATNVVDPLVAGITTLALDHVVELGGTLESIALEKAGIIKPGRPVVSAPQAPEAAAVLARVAAEQGSPLLRVGEEIRIEPSTLCSPAGQRFTLVGRHGRYADLATPLLGAHQQINAAVAVGMAEVLAELGEPVNAAAIRAGVGRVSWPGRLQVLCERPRLLLDGAHDPASVDALLAALANLFPGCRRRYLLGFSREKDWPQMLRQLAPTAHELILTASASPRAVPPDELAAGALPLGVPFTVHADPAAALDATLAYAAPDDLLCVTGSLYMVGDALRWWDHIGQCKLRNVKCPVQQ
jgi:dihydrofolate synthase/folylpolyglutamate synthase